ncbi:MAG: hypothetical protein IJA31_03895 [Clostridia bacterium]|nr:hypothetical protein [Clostridia bacterium]
MGKNLKNSELYSSIRSALSLQTLRQQWKDMISMMLPHKSPPTAEAETGKTVFCMRVRLHEWPRGAGTLVATEKQNFTFGNSDTFDICLNAGNMQVGDVWCSVFFDRTLNGYVVMQAMGSFHVCETGDDEPYRHGDWSLYPEGFDYRTVAQNNLLIPVGSQENPQKTIFHIENYYFIEMWAYSADDEALSVVAKEENGEAKTECEEPATENEEGGDIE